MVQISVRNSKAMIPNNKAKSKKSKKALVEMTMCKPGTINWLGLGQLLSLVTCFLAARTTTVNNSRKTVKEFNLP